MKKKMKKIFLGCSFLVILFFLIILFLDKKSYSTSIINGIENFEISNISYQKESYLLMYPADSRVNQNQTIVKQTLSSGEIIHEYRIVDDKFRRIDAHQKPNRSDIVFLSNFGEPIIENQFYTYNISTKKFKKIDIPYFNDDIGVDNIIHYGEDTLFLTLTSHKTGDQVVNLETGDFKLSISNFSSEQSYESEWGYVPGALPILKLENKILFTALRKYDLPSCIGIIDEESNKITYTNCGDESVSLQTMYSNDKYAYVIDTNGKMYVIDKNLNYTVFSPFKNFSNGNYSYSLDDGAIMLEDDLMLIQILDRESNTYIVGMLTFNERPEFTVIDRDYLDKEVFLKILSYDSSNKEVYLVEMKDKNSNLLVVDSQTLNLKVKIPIEYPHLLDFVIKIG